MTDESLHYPLAWPADWPRTKSRYRARFGDHTIAKARDEVYRQLERMGVRESAVVISSNVAGISKARLTDPGVAVYFEFRKDRRVLACDRWDLVEHNLWAIAKHLEALRGIERWGVGSLERIFTGYTALPAQASGSDWWDLLGIQRDQATPELIAAAYKAKARECHPDLGGSNERMAALNGAREQALAAMEAGTQ